MKAEILAIGTELLIGHVLNTNAAYLSEELNSLGISTLFHSTVGDNPERIKQCLKLAQERSDLVIITGGLGPTSDDLTHETIAEFLNVQLQEIPGQKEVIKQKFAETGREAPQVNYKQAFIPSGANTISNSIGTAAGMIYESNSLTIITLPGVPIEMKDMYQQTVKEFLIDKIHKSGVKQGVILSKKIKFINVGESQMFEMIGAGLFDSVNPSLAPYAILGECYVRITAKADDKPSAEQMISNMQKQVESKMQAYLYGYDEDNVYSLLASQLLKQKLTLAFAESCTGGLASKLMTDLPGASSYTTLNITTYSNESKIKLLKVKPETISQYGAISKECAEEMARGMHELAGADISVAITGVAGPDESEGKPVGTIYYAIYYQGQIHSNKLDWFARSLTRAQARAMACLKTCYQVLRLVG
jgi:nicotinamide-nucleotide amidase